MQAPPTLTGARIRLRAAMPGDLDAIAAIGSEPSVTEWWGPQSREKLASELLGDGLDEVSLVIEAEGSVAGMIQYHEETDPGFRHAGVDIFLGAAWQGRGLGAEAIELLVTYLFDELDHHRITIDPRSTTGAPSRHMREPVRAGRSDAPVHAVERRAARRLLMERLRNPPDPPNPDA